MIEIDSNNYMEDFPKACALQTPLTETDPLAMIYTGGTTGHPKGAVLSHRSIMWNAINTIVSWNLTDKDTTLTCIPMFHTGGLNALSVPVLVAGGTVVLSPGFDPEQAVKDLIEYRVLDRAVRSDNVSHDHEDKGVQESEVPGHEGIPVWRRALSAWHL